MNSTTGIAAAFILACAAVPVRAHAQTPVVRSETLIPDSTLQRIVGVFNRPITTRLRGESTLPAGSALTGDVASLDGSLEVGGRVSGDIVAINSDIHILASAVIEGSVTAADGAIRIENGAVVRGSVVQYREMVRIRDDGDHIAIVEPQDDGDEVHAGRAFAFGRADLLLAVRGSYNRVEGLPVAFGPRFRFGDRGDTRIEALATYRTADGTHLSLDRLGYRAGAESSVGPIRFSADVFRDVAGIHDCCLSDREASLAAIVLHRDYRDHYGRKGWSIGAEMRNPGSPFRGGLLFRSERDTSLVPQDPFSILDNREPWRPEPLVAEGALRSITAALAYDTRNDVTDPTDGWLIESEIERGLGGSLTLPGASGVTPTSDLDAFTAGRIDIRRYARLTPYSRLGIRILASGSVTGDMLPPQRQQVLGGEGNLPAYPFNAFDCGGKVTVAARSDTYASFHGCDRMILTQAEYQASFPFARRIGEKLRLGNWLTNSVRWAAFFDAGRAWNETRGDGRGSGRDDFSAEGGLGIRLGPAGFYWAVPLSGSGYDYNFFFRLGQRL